MLTLYPPFGLISRVIDAVSFFIGERRSGLLEIATEIVRCFIADDYPWSACLYRRSFRVILFLSPLRAVIIRKGLLLAYG